MLQPKHHNGVKNLTAGKGILFLVVLLCQILQLNAQEKNDPLSRLITVRMDTTTVESFLEKLVEENDLFFSYNPDLLPEGKMNFSYSNQPLGEVLRGLLPDSLYNISLADRQLIISRVAPKPLLLSGRVMDREGRTPLPYATINIEGEFIGTMTNNDGNFELKIPYLLRHNKLVVSCVGFRQKKMTTEELKKDSLIFLQGETIRLREIQVKPVDPRTVLQEFRNNIRRNYTEEPQLMQTFYRETARQDGNYVGVWEAVMEILKAPYLSLDQDRVRFLKGRKGDLNRKPKEVMIKIQGGPLGINTLDVVKYQETFLSPEYDYLYQYRFEHPQMINGRLTWIIRFESIAETDFASFNGRMMIDADTYALVGADYSWDKKSLKANGSSFIQKEPFGFDTRPENVEYAVQYRLLNGKWQFYSAHSDVLFRVKQKKKFKTEYRNVTDVIVTQQYTFPRKARFGPEGIFHEKDIFSEKIGTFDKTFWEGYNVIQPDEDLRKAVKESVE